MRGEYKFNFISILDIALKIERIFIHNRLNIIQSIKRNMKEQTINIMIQLRNWKTKNYVLEIASIKSNKL